MHIALNPALRELAETGDENRAWEIAQQDEGLNPETTKARWLIFAYAALERRR